MQEKEGGQLSDEELDAFLSAMGMTKKVEKDPPKQASVDRLLTEAYELTEFEERAPPSQKTPLTRWVITACFSLFLMSFFVFCAHFFSLKQERNHIELLCNEMSSLIEELRETLLQKQEPTEESLLQDLNPMFPEDEIIEPLHPPEDFSVA